MAEMQKDALCFLKILVASALADTLMVQQSIFHLMKLQNGMHVPMSGIAEPNTKYDKNFITYCIFIYTI